MPKKLEPPQRDTGIPSELDINIDIDEGTIFRVFGFCDVVFHVYEARNNMSTLSFSL